jgi:peptidoglycan/LPS O-acetylase OafA/YrhL
VNERTKRNNFLDLLRIIFAVLVLLSHAPEITDGNTSRELFSRLTRTDLSFGTLAVDGFFLLSGFLIVKSWDRNPNLYEFLRNRVLRIVPGYIVAAFLSTIVIGWLAPGIPDFFLHLGKHFWLTIFLLSSPLTPPVLPGSHYPLVNGSLWTISYEFRCYLIVAILGLCGFVRKPAYWLAGTAFLVAAVIFPVAHWSKHYVLYGDPEQVFRLFSTFFIGGCFYLFRERIPFRRWLAIVAVAVLLASRLAPLLFQLGIVCCGGYLMFYAAKAIQTPKPLRKLPDVSYGVYLYGWPVEILWIWYHHGSPWVTFFVSTVISIVMGYLSYRLIEYPALKLKSNSVALPDETVLQST